MKRLLFAALLSLPAFLIAPETASAQGCASGNCGGVIPDANYRAALGHGYGYGYGLDSGSGYGYGRPYANGLRHLGCPTCFGLFSKIHQHGPLFNYGPYTGYYPFEPYGPWNAQLQYTGPRPSDYYSSGWLGLRNRLGSGLHGLRDGCGKCGSRLGWNRGSDCASCGWKAYSLATYRNVFKRLNPFSGRVIGHGCASGDCAAGELSANTSPILESNPIQPTSYPRTER